MRDGIVLHVKGLGVLVQHPKDEGFQLRWSCDPEVSNTAPAHVFIGEKQFKRFLEVGLPQKYLNADYVNVIPVKVGDTQDSVSKPECVSIGINVDNWNNVLAPYALLGKGNSGLHSHWGIWTGTREQFADADHKREAIMTAQKLGITSPLVFTEDDTRMLLNLAKKSKEHRQEMHPNTRMAELLLEATAKALSHLNIDDLHPERAKVYLKDVQAAMVSWSEQREIEAAMALVIDKHVQVAAMPTPQDTQESAKAKPRGPSMH